MRPLFIASLGNPGPNYLHTLHSAGHTLLIALQRTIPTSPFSMSDRAYSKAPIARAPDDNVLLWQSPTFMNESGPALATAWATFCRACRIPSSSSSYSASHSGENMGNDTSSSSPHLIILHDELELPFGRFSIKTSTGTSARGHNGLKSVMSIPALKACKLTRVGLGIGRPQSRDPDVVSGYVLEKMSRAQKETVEGLADRVWADLKAREMVGISPKVNGKNEVKVSGGRRVVWR